MIHPKPLRIGIIGTGTFAEVGHIPGLLTHPHAKIVAVCGRRLEAARTLAEKFGIRHATDDFHAICNDPEIDAVTIATANAAHASQAIDALRHGKHVFCEKPLAVTAAEAREMTRVARDSGRIHQTAFTFRYNYGLQELRRRVAAGDIGRPFLARIQYDRWDGLAPHVKSGWHMKKGISSAGMLFDVGSHLFDITRYVLGPIDSVIGYTHSLPEREDDRTRFECDDLVNAWSRHANGVRGQFFVSRITPPFAPLGYLEIVGDQGALKASLSRGGVDFLKASSPAAPEWKDLPLPPDAFDGKPHALGLMMRGFVDACMRGSLDPEVDASFEDGLAAQLAMAALLESQESNRWIHLDEV